MADMNQPITRDQIVELIDRAHRYAAPRHARAKLDPHHTDLSLAELGLDSISIMEMVGFLEEHLQIELDEGALHALQTLDNLVELVHQHALARPG
jgi:acyl carrier protein